MACASSLSFAARCLFAFGMFIESALDSIPETIDCLADCASGTLSVVRSDLTSNGAAVTAKARPERDDVRVVPIN